jgi:hypothetical protein
MLGFVSKIHSQGVVVIQPTTPSFYNALFSGTLDEGIDINGDGTNEFILRSNDSGTGLNNAVLIPVGSNMIVGGSGGYLANMTIGDVVGSSLASSYQWSSSMQTISVLAILLGQDTAESGNFAYQTNGYIGFDWVINGQNYYGWMEVSSIVNDAAIYGEITEIAYETSPNTPITIGEVPEPSTWALLVCGGFALMKLRRKSC